MRPLKKRDIPTPDRPVAYMNFINSLGELPMAQRAMIGLGECFKAGKDYFGATKHVHHHNRILVALKDVSDKRVAEHMAKDYFLLIKERIEKCKLPDFPRRNLLSLISANHRNFLKTINS